jgi:hypothetical protein
MGLLDSILGAFAGNSGTGGTPPDTASAPSSGALPPAQAPALAADPSGNPIGGGGLAAALGLNPDTARRVSAGLAGGLSNVKNSPFPWQVAANAAGGAFAGENKSDETNTTQTLQAIDRALKLQQINQLGRYRDDMSDAKFSQLGINQQKADQAGTYRNGGRVIGQQNADASAAIPRTEAPVIDGETRKAAQADRAGTLAQARDAVARDPSKRAAIIERLQQLGIAF